MLCGTNCGLAYIGLFDAVDRCLFIEFGICPPHALCSSSIFVTTVQLSQINEPPFLKIYKKNFKNSIGSNDIFSAMSDEQRTLLIRQKFRKYKSNSIVYAKNQSSDMIYYIIDGTIEICDPLPEEV